MGQPTGKTPFAYAPVENMAAEPEIIALGSINVDLQMRIGRWPNRGETMMGSDFMMAGGGKAANVALLARKLGARSRLIACTGDDSLASVALTPLAEAGVDLRFARRLPGFATGVSCIMVQPQGEKGIFLASNANDGWTSAEDQEKAAAAVRDAPDGSVFVADLEIAPAVVEASLRAARERGFLTVFDPSPAGRMKEAFLPLIDYLTPNPSEAEALTGIKVEDEESGYACGRILLEKGAGGVLAKMPDGGCACTTGEARFHLVPGERVEVDDKTGAGDAFAGAFAVALLEGQALERAVRFAIESAGIAVTRYGSQRAYPDREELEKKLS